jgi:hypothetical protein
MSPQITETDRVGERAVIAVEAVLLPAGFTTTCRSSYKLTRGDLTFDVFISQGCIVATEHGPSGMSRMQLNTNVSRNRIVRTLAGWLQA